MNTQEGRREPRQELNSSQGPACKTDEVVWLSAEEDPERQQRLGFPQHGKLPKESDGRWDLRTVLLAGGSEPSGSELGETRGARGVVEGEYGSLGSCESVFQGCCSRTRQEGRLDVEKPCS